MIDHLLKYISPLELGTEQVTAENKLMADLLIEEATFLHGVTDKVAEIQDELRRMKCFLKDADARQGEGETVRNWVAEIRENAFDAEDTIDTFVHKIALRRRRGFQSILKRYACISTRLGRRLTT